MIMWDKTVMTKSRIPGIRADGDWCKRLDSVDADAVDGRGYHGDWIAVGGRANLLPGALLLNATYDTHERRGEELQSADIGVVQPNGGIWWIASSRDHDGWAQELRKAAREWLALSRPERVVRRCRERVKELTDCLAVVRECDREVTERMLATVTRWLAEIETPRGSRDDGGA